MDILALVLGLVELTMREVALFAAFGFFLLGLSDLAVDFVWIVIATRRRLILGRLPTSCAQSLTAPAAPGPIAVFVPAWDEAAVIGEMLRHARAAFGGEDYRIYVGCYPNDPATIAAVRALEDGHIRVVIGPTPGPTSKADCLNRLWERMRGDETAERRRFKAVLLHDAEDIVHSSELRLFYTLIERFDVVQLPVVPLIDPNSRWVSGHYIDEFLEAHGKELVVREAIGASLPLAGVGCAISRDALERIAAVRGAPFDPECLTEDYELGLSLGALGGRAAFVRLPSGPGRPAVATRALFPGDRKAAINQKARWMTGIALSGWDRLGWDGGLAERWMRLRDRQSVLAAVILAAAYLSLLLWVGLYLLEWLGAREMAPFSSFFGFLVTVNLALLVWRLGWRYGFVASAYGWREGLRAMPRVVVSNIVAMAAARQAMFRYLGFGGRGRPFWDKTAHVFPRQLPAE